MSNEFDDEDKTTGTGLDTSVETTGEIKGIKDELQKLLEQVEKDPKTKASIVSLLFKKYGLINNESIKKELLTTFKDNLDLSDSIEQATKEKNTEARFASHKEKLTTASAGFTIPVEDASYIESRTGGDPIRKALYSQAAFVMRAKPEELTKAGIPQEQVQDLKEVVKSLGFRDTFSGEQALQTKKFAGITESNTRDAQSLIKSTLPTDRLKSTEITRIGDTLTYKDPSNPRAKFRIDMAKEPPRLSQSLGGITIEMITPEETTDGKGKINRLNTVKGEKNVLSTTLESGLKEQKIDIKLEKISIKDLEKMRESSVIQEALTLSEGGKVLTDQEINNLRVRAQGNTLELRTIDILATSNSDRKDIKEIKSVMDYSEYPIPDFSDKQRRIDGGIGSMKKILELKGGLGAYIEKREEELTLQEQIKGLKGPDASEFAKNARKNLEFLNSVGFGNLENKQILTNTMAAMNEINPPGANGEPFIDPTLNTGLGEERQRTLLNALVQITRVAYDAQPQGQGTEWEKSKKWMSGWRNTDLSDTILMRRMITSDGWRDAVKNVTNGTESSRWNKDAIKSKLGGSISQESELPKAPTGTKMAGEPTMNVG